MAKIENISLEVGSKKVELKIYASAMIFVLFKKQYEKSIDQHLRDNPSDMEALSFIIQKAHESACKIEGKDSVYNQEDILTFLSIEDMTEAVNKLFPSSKKEGEKKTEEKMKKG